MWPQTARKELSKTNPFRKCHVNESKNISRHATFVTEPMRDWPEGSPSLHLPEDSSASDCDCDHLRCYRDQGEAGAGGRKLPFCRKNL